MRQFLSTFRRVKDLKGDELLWGDEIEYGVFHLDPVSKKVRLSLRAKQVSRSIPMIDFIPSFLRILYTHRLFLFLDSLLSDHGRAE